MAIELNSNGGTSSFKRKVFAAGAVDARVLQVIDIGMQYPNEKYAYDDKGNKKPPRRSIMVTFEASDLFTEYTNKEGETEESNARFFKTMTVSAHEKAAMRPLLMAVGAKKSLDLKDLLDVPVTLAIDKYIGNDGTERNGVRGLSQMSKRASESLPKLVGDKVLFDFDAPDAAVFEKLPDFVKEIIQSSANFSGSKVAEVLGGGEAKAVKEAPKAKQDEVSF